LRGLHGRDCSKNPISSHAVAQIDRTRQQRAEWLSCTAISRLVGSGDDRRIRARLDYLVRDGKIERKREQGTHGLVYLYRPIS
jgi:hypothetical protein